MVSVQELAPGSGVVNLGVVASCAQCGCLDGVPYRVAPMPAGLGRRAAEQPGQQCGQRGVQCCAAARQRPHRHEDAVLRASDRVGAPLQSLDFLKQAPLKHTLQESCAGDALRVRSVLCGPRSVSASSSECQGLPQ